MSSETRKRMRKVGKLKMFCVQSTQLITVTLVGEQPKQHFIVQRGLRQPVRVSMESIRFLYDFLINEIDGGAFVRFNGTSMAGIRSVVERNLVNEAIENVSYAMQILDGEYGYEYDRDGGNPPS